jgi:hypothetical protein
MDTLKLHARLEVFINSMLRVPGQVDIGERRKFNF